MSRTPAQGETGACVSTTQACVLGRTPLPTHHSPPPSPLPPPLRPFSVFFCNHRRAHGGPGDERGMRMTGKYVFLPFLRPPPRPPVLSKTRPGAAPSSRPLPSGPSRSRSRAGRTTSSPAPSAALPAVTTKRPPTAAVLARPLRSPHPWPPHPSRRCPPPPMLPPHLWLAPCTRLPAVPARQPPQQGPEAVKDELAFKRRRAETGERLLATFQPCAWSPPTTPSPRSSQGSSSKLHLSKTARKGIFDFDSLAERAEQARDPASACSKSSVQERTQTEQ